MEISTVVVLLDQDAVLGDSGHGDAVVGDAFDGSSFAGLGLDADGLDGLGDGRGEELNTVDDVDITTSDGTDGETVTAGAVAAGEDDVCAGVDSHAVVLVVDYGAGDGDTG